jgi:hypothetical protein
MEKMELGGKSLSPLQRKEFEQIGRLDNKFCHLYN